MDLTVIKHPTPDDAAVLADLLCEVADELRRRTPASISYAIRSKHTPISVDGQLVNDRKLNSVSITWEDA